MENSEIINLKEHLNAASGPEERFKRYRGIWEKTEKCRALTDFPMHLDIELSGVCNLKCEQCFQNGYIEGKLGFMDVGLFKKIIDQGTTEGLCAIKLQIRGESLLHPGWFECCRYAADAGVMDMQLTSNATLLSEETAQKILDSGLDGIIFSVDSHHGQSIKKLKKAVGHMEEIDNKIRGLLELRARQGKTRPWVRVVTSNPEMDDEIFATAKQSLMDRFPDADFYIVNRLHNFSEVQDSYSDLHENYNLMPCKYLFQRLAIFWDGSVTVCCMDYNGRFNLGNASETSIKDIWLGKKLQRMRERHLRGKRIKMDICKHCHACIEGGHADYVQRRHPHS